MQFRTWVRNTKGGESVGYKRDENGKGSIQPGLKMNF
jgi:hypothetical protein